ncbi:MAG TPA: protein kinase [Isosphaeraceae bacterium]|nr:protein kinase [Isosphaeraceae bacterium]
MSQNSALIGERLGSYKLESVLGSGAMGVVYRGTDEKRGRPVAVKVVTSEIAHGGKVQKRFQREYEILNQFRHPGIVRNLGYGRYRGTLYIAMEFIQGLTLEKVLQERGAMPWREVVDLGIQICDALHYAHERGVIHRDLKPSNLMVTAEGKVKLTDFGIAKDLDKTALTATGRTLGTAAYMAPEQIRGTPAVSHKTDLYALGVVLFQMLTGKPPFEGNTPVVLMHCHLNEPAPRPSTKVAEIPRALDELVISLMAKTPADRPWDAAAVTMVLTELRDKAERGAAIPMVWPSSGPGGANPATAGTGRGETARTDRPRRKSRKVGTLATFASTLVATRSRSVADAPDAPGVNRAAIETALLVLALFVVGGFIAYWVWPPGQEYLYRHAEALMKSSRHSDWITALEEYIEPLDRRFPLNPYKEQTQKWRDRIFVYEADGRFKVLTAPVQTSFSKPNTNAERQIVITHAVAAEALAHGNDRAAVRQWRELAGELNPDDPEEHKWQVWALHHAQELENAIQDRRQFVEKQLQLAEEAFRTGRTEEAKAILKKLIDQYRKYTDLADLFPASVPTEPSPAPASPPPAAPAPPQSAGSPEESPAPAPKPGSAAPAEGQAKPAAPSEPVPKDDRPQTAGDPDPTAVAPRQARSPNTSSANSVVND